MTPEQFTQQLQKSIVKAKRYIKSQAPRIAGQIAVNHVRADFRRGGLTDNGFRQWPMTKRQQSGGSGAASQYGPLLSGRNRLMNSITAQPGEGRVRIYTDVPYAAVHNFGGILRPRVTPKMRKFAWAMFYKETGYKKGKKSVGASLAGAQKWKALALTKKTQLSVRIPQRQFLPPKPAPELMQKIEQRIDKDLMKIIQS
ncbi:MAG: phage virion morphogenesis protein [Bacteroides sp.]|nr:phage virion morphogenesis protein [Bacteroides sp.]